MKETERFVESDMATFGLIGTYVAAVIIGSTMAYDVLCRDDIDIAWTKFQIIAMMFGLWGAIAIGDLVSEKFVEPTVCRVLSLTTVRRPIQFACNIVTSGAIFVSAWLIMRDASWMVFPVLNAIQF